MREDAPQLETRFQYITFVLERDTGRTQVWSCRNLQHGEKLGWIQWYAPWRQYCFLGQTGVIFSAGCLKDMQTFIQRLMEARKG